MQVFGGVGFIAGHDQMHDQPIAQLELSGGMFAAPAVLAEPGFEWQFAAQVFFGPCRQWKRMVFPNGQFNMAANPSIFLLEDFLGDHDVAKIVARWQVIGRGLHSGFVGFKNASVFPGGDRPMFGNGEGKSEDWVFKNACHARDDTVLLKLGA
jgi:hypothetical protein